MFWGKIWFIVLVFGVKFYGMVYMLRVSRLEKGGIMVN